jgi:hypothetical protein
MKRYQRFMFEEKSRPFLRSAVLVSQHPLHVQLIDVEGGNPYMAQAAHIGIQTFLQRATLQAVRQVRGGKEHWVVREDLLFFDYQPSKIAEEQLGPWSNKTVLAPDEFDALAELFMSNSDGKLREFILLTEELVPEMQIAPKRVHALLAREEEAYSKLPRYFARYDLWPYEALVWINRSDNQLPKKELERLRMADMPAIHLGGGWYAFERMDDAIAIKLSANQTEVHPLRD